MTKLIRWQDCGDRNELQWSHDGTNWRPYTAHPMAKADTVLNGIATSKGFRTAQYLLTLGYSYLPAKSLP